MIIQPNYSHSQLSEARKLSQSEDKTTINAGDQTRDRQGDGRQSRTRQEPDECDLSSTDTPVDAPVASAQPSHNASRGNHLDLEA